MTKPKSIYKVIFIAQSATYEIYARHVTQSNLLGFIEVEELIFGKEGLVVVDPSEERLKNEFLHVRRSYIPLHAILRIDEVIKEGVAKIKDQGSNKGSVSPFPSNPYSTHKNQPVQD